MKYIFIKTVKVFVLLFFTEINLFTAFYSHLFYNNYKYLYGLWVGEYVDGYHMRSFYFLTSTL